MNFYLEYILGAFILGVLFLINDYFQKTNNLKEKMKEISYLENENNELKKIIFDLSEEKQFLKEIIIAFKGDKISRRQLIEDFQILIAKEEEEREKRRLEKIQNRIKTSEIINIDLKEEDKDI